MAQIGHCYTISTLLQLRYLLDAAYSFCAGNPPMKWSTYLQIGKTHYNLPTYTKVKAIWQPIDKQHHCFRKEDSLTKQQCCSHLGRKMASIVILHLLNQRNGKKNGQKGDSWSTNQNMKQFQNEQTLGLGLVTCSCHVTNTMESHKQKGVPCKPYRVWVCSVDYSFPKIF